MSAAAAVSDGECNGSGGSNVDGAVAMGGNASSVAAATVAVADKSSFASCSGRGKTLN